MKNRPGGNPAKFQLLHTDGEFPGRVGSYSKKEDILKLYQSYIADYIRQVVKQGGSDTGLLYVSRVAPGGAAGCVQ